MQRIVWIQLYSRESRKANDGSVRAVELGSVSKLALPQELTDIVDMRDYLFNPDKFKNRLADIQPHDVYVYSDADCKDPVPLDAMFSDIRTSASQPL